MMRTMIRCVGVDGVAPVVSAGKDAMPRAGDNGLAGIIKRLRSEFGLTQEQFAAKVGVTWSTVNRWENGRGSPSPLAMRRIEELQQEAVR